MASVHHRWLWLLGAGLFCLCQVETKSTQLERIINGEGAKPQQFPYQIYDIKKK